MVLELFLVIYGIVVGIIVIITSRFFGNLIIKVRTDMRSPATDTFGNKGWIKIWFSSWWTLMIWFRPKFFIWGLRIFGIITVSGCVFILIWVYILGN